MKILKVEANNRRRVFEIHTRKGVYILPFAKVESRPTSKDPIRRLYVDAELGREGFAWVLDSGKEGCMHIDGVLDYNADPDYMTDQTLYSLSCEAQEQLKASGLSAREVARRLRTSPTQLYRLLDQTNYRKSLKQMLALLWVLGCDVDVRVKRRRARTA